MKIKKVIALFSLLSLFIVSCSKSDSDIITPPNTGEEPEEPLEDIWNVNREGQYALNVVFFKPSDYNLTQDIINNISDMTLYIQQWYQVQMELNGYGKKTFGLVTNQFGKVRVHVIEDSNSSSYYFNKETADPYSTLPELKAKIDNYFNSHPGYKAGSHTLVLSNEETLIRFVGSGQYAFARSTDFELSSTGKYIESLELMNTDRLGGIMHELGHALNLPHNCQRASDLPGVALMSFGNHTYEDGGEEKVFLTASSTAILDVCEAFNKTTNGVQYYTSSEMKIESFTLQKDVSNKLIHAQGILHSDIPATSLYIGHDGAPFGGANNNYDEITFTVKLMSLSDNKYSFDLNMPYSDLFNGYKDEYKDNMMLSIYAIAANGIKNTLYQYNYTIDLSTQTPNDDIIKVFEQFEFNNRSIWEISANSTSPNAARTATTMLDGDISSYWHSNYPYNIATDGPHEITIDMKAVNTFKGIYLYSNRSGSNFRPKHISVQTSNDGTNYTEVKEHTIDDINNAIEVRVDFDSDVTASYFKILVDAVYMSTGTEENLIFNEIDIIK